MDVKEQEMDSRLTSIFQDALGDRTLVLNDQLSRGDCNGWDSLGHVKLIMALEEEFGVKFAIGQMASLTSVADIKKALARRGAD
jgi:acyl carrier protein